MGSLLQLVPTTLTVMPLEASFQFLLYQASRLTPPLRQQFSSSPVLVSPLTLLLSTPCSSARAGFRKDLTPVMLLITSLSRRSSPSRDNLLRIIMVVVKIHIYT